MLMRMTPLDRERRWTLGLALAATLAWTMAVGKEIGWDVIHHHLYLPFSWLSGRFATDLFAANTQSFQNPLGYVPFYLMVVARWPAWVIGVTLASVHALCIWPLWQLAVRLWPDPPQWAFRVLSVMAAWLSPIFLLNAGSSSIDPYSALLVLGALALVLTPAAAALRMVLAGGLMGLAFALKPSNAVFLLAGMAMVLWRLTAGVGRWRDLGFQMLGCFAVAILAMGAWSAWLWRAFANPVFPLFNNVFKSPYAPIEPAPDLRFMPDGLADLALRLFEFATFRTYVHTEGFAPDLRPLALAVAALPALALWLRRMRMRRAPMRGELGSDTAALAVFCGVSYVAWLLISGNSRYAIALFMLCGLLLVRALDAALPRPWSVAAALSLLAIQAMVFGLDGDHRYMARPWDARPYLDVDVPERLAREPFLHLSIGTPSMAGVAPYLASSGAFANIIGPLSLPDHGPLGELLAQRLQRWEGRVRFLVRGGRGSFDGADDTMRRRFDRIVYRFGLAFDWRDCLEIRIQLDTHATGTNRGFEPVQSCAAKRREVDDPNYASDVAMADRIFEIAEQQCPSILGPSPMVTDADLGAWQRRYLSSSARLMLSEDEGLLLTHIRSARVIRLGSAEEVLEGSGKSACVAWNELGVK